MARRPLTSNNAPTIDISQKVGLTFEGTLQGVRAIPFGTNRDGSPDVRYIADFSDGAGAAEKEMDKDGNWSAWIGTQVRNLLVDMTTNQLKVPRFSRLWLTYTGEVPTKGGGNPTKLYNVEIDDTLSESPSAPEVVPGKAPHAAEGDGAREAEQRQQQREEREPVAAGRGSRSRR